MGPALAGKLGKTQPWRFAPEIGVFASKARCGLDPAAALGWPGYLLQKCVNFACKTSALVSVGIRSELRISDAVVALKIQSYRIKPESK